MFALDFRLPHAIPGWTRVRTPPASSSMWKRMWRSASAHPRRLPESPAADLLFARATRFLGINHLKHFEERTTYSRISHKAHPVPWVRYFSPGNRILVESAAIQTCIRNMEVSRNSISASFSFCLAVMLEEGHSHWWLGAAAVGEEPPEAVG